MRLAVITACELLYGSEKALLEILDAFPTEIRRNTSMFVPGRTQFSSMLRTRDLRVLEYSTSPRLPQVSSAALLARILAARPSAIYANEGGLLRLTEWASRTLRVPATVHVRTLEEAAYVSAHSSSAGADTHFVANSEFTSAHVRVPEWRKSVFIDGFAQRSLRSSLSIPSENPFTIGVLGRISPAKNQQFVIEALSDLSDTSAFCALIVGGAPPEYRWYEDALRSLVGQKSLTGAVEILPFTSDVQQFYERINLLVIPSVREPLGRCYFEALQAGVPILAADDGGPSELIRKHRVGMLYRAGDRADFLVKLRYIRENYSKERQRVIERRNSILEMYDIDRYVEELMGVIFRRGTR